MQSDFIKSELLKEGSDPSNNNQFSDLNYTNLVLYGTICTPWMYINLVFPSCRRRSNGYGEQLEKWVIK
jgi:hypothetical protein